MTLRDVIELVEERPKTIKNFRTEPLDVLQHFDTEAVHIETRALPDAGSDGFVLLYNTDTFERAVPIELFEVLESPPLAPPWEPWAEAPETEPFTRLLTVLDDTPFAEFDRRQMLATSRAIEERAWRYGYGTLFSGFQSADALARQQPVYAKLASGSELTFELYVNDDVDSFALPRTAVHEHSDDDLGRCWFVLYDAGGDESNKCGLLAEERSPNSFHGFWTQDPDRVDSIISYLRATYD